MMPGPQIFTEVDVRLTYVDGKPVPIALIVMGDDEDGAVQFISRWLLAWRADQEEREAAG